MMRWQRQPDFLGWARGRLRGIPNNDRSLWVFTSHNCTVTHLAMVWRKDWEVFSMSEVKTAKNFQSTFMFNWMPFMVWTDTMERFRVIWGIQSFFFFSQLKYSWKRFTTTEMKASTLGWCKHRIKAWNDSSVIAVPSQGRTLGQCD